MCRKLIYLNSFVLVLMLVGNAGGEYGTGLRGEYFHWSGVSPPAREAAFKFLVLTRIDPTINFYWNPGPNPPPGVRTDNFAVRWSGEIEAQYSEAYTFITGSDDGVRLYVNDELIIDNWTDHDRTVDTSDPIELVAGQRYPIVLEGYENGGEAEWQLYWQSRSTSREVVPQQVLYPLAKPQDLTASNPVPADGAMYGNTWVNLGWTPGTFAVSHDVYFGENFDDVNDGAPGTFQCNQASTYFVVGFHGLPYADGLNPGTIYYWRIDEVESNGTTKHKGEVWSFETLPDLPITVLPVIGASFPGISEIDSILLAWLVENGFEAATIAIMKDRRLVYKKGYGWQNSGRTQPISPDAVMRLASNTKPITARAIKQLIEDRIIRAGDKVYQFLDIPPISGREIHDERIFDITIQHILDHKSGLIGNAPGTGQLGRMLGLNRPATMAETIAYTWTQNLLFAPGSDSRYSNLGYQILGHIIEKASGRTYEEYIREHIAQPLGITTFQVARNGMNNALPNEIWYAGQYFDFQEIDVYQSLGRVPQPYAIDMETRPGAGSLVSSAEDFCRFLKSYFHTGEHKPENLSGIIWTYTFFGSLPGTLTATRDIIKPNGSSIAYVVLVNERIDGRDDILPNLVSDLDAFLTNLESWPNIDLFLIEDWIPPPPPPPPPSVTDTISDALDTSLNFTTGGSADWFSQTTMTRYDGDAAQSGDISHSQESWMQTTVSGTGTVKFYWKVSSEEDFDFLEFYIDGSLQEKISGLVNWEYNSYTISTSGSHTLEWRYMKDGSGNSGSDCSWVDKVEWLAN